MRLVMVVIGRAEIRLAGGEATGHLHIEESIGHSKALLHLSSFNNMLLLRGQLRAEQRVQFVVRLYKAQLAGSF